MSHAHLLIDRRVGVRVESSIGHALVLLVLIGVARIVVNLTYVRGVHQLVLLGRHRRVCGADTLGLGAVGRG